ncbi:unnamed protein product [Meloidogyne enterolobii]|uniref:Uncharacterized protein n=1 Tax=Meloidogyne enterolobii TaxID=390850 RepID=A0ACB0YUB6_MELEN
MTYFSSRFGAGPRLNYIRFFFSRTLLVNTPFIHTLIMGRSLLPSLYSLSLKSR